jgi:hypothetical protein
MRNHSLALGSATALLLAAPLALLHGQNIAKYWYLQKAVELAMKGRAGSAVVADVTTERFWRRRGWSWRRTDWRGRGRQ